MKRLQPPLREILVVYAAVQVVVLSVRPKLFSLPAISSSLIEVATIKEIFHGIDPRYRCFGTVVWGRRVLGSP
jgi:hypothetical protein